MTDGNQSLDDILASALEDFEEEERNQRATTTAITTTTATTSATHEPVDPLSESSQRTNTTPLCNEGEEAEVSSTGDDDDDLDNLPPELINGLKKLAESVNKESGSGDPGSGGLQDLLGSDEMMKEALEQLENSPEFTSIMENMVGSLLSKDVLYEPIKQMKDRYPEWLANNRDKVSEEDYTRYSRQYEYVQRLCVLYENNGSMTDIMNIMQEMQEQGQPPDEIVQEMAPGFAVGSDGNPQIPELEEMLKGMEGVPGMGEGKDKCALM